MTTIEIHQIDKKQNRRLIIKVASLLSKNEYFHFFYEPRLIVRVRNQSVGKITRYLSKRKIAYNTYPYPFAKNVGKWGTGRGYGEDRKSVVYRHRDEFLPIMHLNSKLAIKRRKRDDIKIIERETHTLFNAFDYDWVDEARILAYLSGGRTRLIRRYESQTLASSLICLLIIKLSVINMFLLKSLK